jgi:hypothetical protein
MVKVKSLAYYLCMKNDILYINFGFNFFDTYGVWRARCPLS